MPYRLPSAQAEKIYVGHYGLNLQQMFCLNVSNYISAAVIRQDEYLRMSRADTGHIKLRTSAKISNSHKHWSSISTFAHLYPGQLSLSSFRGR